MGYMEGMSNEAINMTDLDTTDLDFLPDNISPPRSTPAKPVKKNCAPKNTPIKKILNHISINPNATAADIAKACNVSRQAVSQMLIRYGVDDKCLESFKKNRADIFAGIQETVAASLTEGDIKKASVRDRTILLGTLYDKERLERGLSTQNSAVILASAVLEADRQVSDQAKVDRVIDVDPSPDPSPE